MAIATPRLAPRLFDYWVAVLRRTWRGSVITSLLMPFLYLTAMGVGLGSFVDENSGPQALEGVSYLAFIAPGLLATTAMQTAVIEATYPVMSGFKWDKSYYSMVATPLEVPDIVVSQLVSIAFRVFVTCGVFLGVLAAYGALTNWWGGPAALLVSVVIGLAHAAPVFGYSARAEDPSSFALLFRLGLMPMMLFSGAFFPISQLPDSVVWIAYITPIWHGVELSRMLTLGSVNDLAALGHLLYLLLWLVVGYVVAIRRFERRLAE